VAALTDGAGNVQNTYSYDPLGNATSSGNVPNSFTFNGWMFNSLTGYCYTGSGYYDPATGQSFGCKDRGPYDTPGSEDFCGEDEAPYDDTQRPPSGNTFGSGVQEGLSIGGIVRAIKGWVSNAYHALARTGASLVAALVHHARSIVAPVGSFLYTAAKNWANAIGVGVLVGVYGGAAVGVAAGAIVGFAVGYKLGPKGAVFATGAGAVIGGAGLAAIGAEPGSAFLPTFTTGLWSRSLLP
jgi:hypothetical protein